MNRQEYHSSHSLIIPFTKECSNIYDLENESRSDRFLECNEQVNALNILLNVIGYLKDCRKQTSGLHCTVHTLGNDVRMFTRESNILHSYYTI